MKIKAEQYSELIAAYTAGKNAMEVAKEFGCSQQTVLRILDRTGTRRKSISEASRDRRRVVRKHFFNESIFSSGPTDEKSAYLLGLLMADGYINETSRHSVSLTSIDLHLIQLFRDILECDYPISVNTKGKETWNDRYSMTVNSKRLVKDLSALGCGQRKSLTLEYPKDTPEDLHRHIIRGLWDGDGSVFLTQPDKKYPKKYLRLSLCGSFSCMSSVKEILSNQGFTGYLHKHGNIFTLTYYKYARALHKWLYEGSSYYLPRKAKEYSVIEVLDK